MENGSVEAGRDNLFGISSEEVQEYRQLGDAKRTLAYSLIGVELLVHLWALPISLANFSIVYRTTIIHRNLKFILLCQSTAIISVGLTRCFFTTPVKMATGDIFWVETEIRCAPVAFLFGCPLFFRMFLGHVIIVERSIATLMARFYERLTSSVFSFGWFCAIVFQRATECDNNIQLQFLVALTNFLIELYTKDAIEKSNNTLFSFCVSVALTVISLIDIFIFARLWAVNKANLRQEFVTAKNQARATSRSGQAPHYNLTKRYQHLENVRTALQLWPTLLIYFLIQLNTTSNQTFHYYFFTPDDYPMEIISQCNSLFVAILNFLIEVTTIACHPILRQNFLSFLRHVLPTRVAPSPTGIPPESTAGILSDNSNRLLQNSALGMAATTVVLTERHFALLRQTWE